MARVGDPKLLAAVYQETLRLIGQIPTVPLAPHNTTLYRKIEAQYLAPTTRGIFPRQQANFCLLVRDELKNENRFSGVSMANGVPSWGGLYCSPHPQALMNEILHYAPLKTRLDPITKRPVRVPITRDPGTGFANPHAALNRECIIKIRLMGSFLMAELSPSNGGARPFVNKLEASVRQALQAMGDSLSLPKSKSLWDLLFDSLDCSVGRGIGLAVASSASLRGLKAQTVRPSDRSPEETGDNVVFFGHNGQQIAGLWVEEAYVFPIRGEMQVYPVKA